MTPQSNFMVLAPIIPERETELRQLLDSMNRGPGQVDPNNALLPFAEFETLHFARFVILDDKTTRRYPRLRINAAHLSAVSGIPGRRRWRCECVSGQVDQARR